METYLITVSKYLFIALMLFYTWECFSALRSKNPIKQAGIYQRQNGVIFLVYIIGMAMVFMFEKDVPQINVIILAGAQLCFLIIVLGVFPVIYTNINKAILSNMCMLLTIGFIILARLDYQGSITHHSVYYCSGCFAVIFDSSLYDAKRGLLKETHLDILLCGSRTFANSFSDGCNFTWSKTFYGDWWIYIPTI